ncbi:MAG: VWA domain-containing protein [Anaerolineaceae bacterium]|nr:VWA domain-containing protein [Anaerolineaceae bacterium]
MQLARIEFLYLFLLLPLIFLFFFWSKKRKALHLSKIGQSDLLKQLTQSINQNGRRIKTVLWFLAFCSLVLALARPLWGTKLSVRSQEGVEIIAALDISNSMLAEDFKPNRLTRAKLTIQDLMDKLAGNDIGLVVFSGSAFVQFPLTSDFHTAITFLDQANPSSISRQGTALEEAIEISLKAFSAERSVGRVILLLSDGENHEGSPLEAAKKAQEQGVIIHCIGFGSTQGEPIPIRDVSGEIQGYLKDNGETVLTRLDEDILKEIAFETGGSYVLASPQGKEIEALVNKISAMDSAESEDRFELKGIERFTWFSGFTLLVLCVELLISERKNV